VDNGDLFQSRLKPNYEQVGYIFFKKLHASFLLIDFLCPFWLQLLELRGRTYPESAVRHWHEADPLPRSPPTIGQPLSAGRPTTASSFVLPRHLPPPQGSGPIE